MNFCTTRTIKDPFAILVNRCLAMAKFLEREIHSGQEWFSWAKVTHKTLSFCTMDQAL